MLLHCGMDGGAGEEARRAAAWLGAATLESLAELNEAGLSLLAEQATVAAEPRALLREVGALWRTLDPAARRRAAAAPYLFLDGGFGDPERWQHSAGREVADPGRASQPAFFTVPATVEVARLHFTFAWHLARAQSAAARLLLGMLPGCAALIAGCTLRRMNTLAERHPEWLRPRWPSHPELWRQLLVAAGAGEGRALERARLHGVTMLAAEVRAAAGEAVGRTAQAPERARLTSPAGTVSTAPSPRSPARP